MNTNVWQDYKLWTGYISISPSGSLWAEEEDSGKEGWQQGGRENKEAFQLTLEGFNSLKENPKQKQKLIQGATKRKNNKNS